MPVCRPDQKSKHLCVYVCVCCRSWASAHLYVAAIRDPNAWAYSNKPQLGIPNPWEFPEGPIKVRRWTMEVSGWNMEVGGWSPGAVKEAPRFRST